MLFGEVEVKFTFDMSSLHVKDHCIESLNETSCCVTTRAETNIFEHEPKLVLVSRGTVNNRNPRKLVVLQLLHLFCLRFASCTIISAWKSYTTWEFKPVIIYYVHKILLTMWLSFDWFDRNKSTLSTRRQRSINNNYTEKTHKKLMWVI